MAQNDCCFTRNGVWFRYRVAAIIIEDDSVLMIRDPRFDYYYTVGGGVHQDETSEDAIRREVLEETGVAYEVDRLAAINESFFDGHDGAIDGLRCHVLELYYLMKPRGTKALPPVDSTETAFWLPISEYGRHKVFPTFLPDWLRERPQHIWHIVSRENEIRE